MITELHFRSESLNGWIRRSVIISRPEQEDTQVWLEVPERYSDWLTDQQDPLLRMALFFIMEQEGECRIHAEIDRTLLENLSEHMRIWQLWCPGRYFCPKLVADSIVDRTPVGSRGEAICAFSGGVDGAFALTSHKAGHWGDLSLNISAAVMVHGADTSLEEQEEFNDSFARAEEALRELGVELIPVRANSHQYPNIVWGHAYCSVVSAALSLFGARFCRGILGSDDIASKEMIMLQIPHGMNYVTDRLYNSASFTCNIIGCDTTRTERCRFISRFPGIMKQLLICWQSKPANRNCGVCPKCLRTALNFMVSGCSELPPFDRPFSPDELRKVDIGTVQDFCDFEEIYNYDQKTHALTEEARAALHDLIEKYEPIYKPQNLTLSSLLRLSRYKMMMTFSQGKRREKYRQKIERYFN